MMKMLSIVRAIPLLLVLVSASPSCGGSANSESSLSNPTLGNCANSFYPVSPTLKRNYRTTYTSIQTEPGTYTESFSDVGRESFTLNMDFQNLSMKNAWKCSSEGLASQRYARLDFSGASSKRMSFDTLSQSGVTIPAEKDWHRGFKWNYGFEIASRTESQTATPEQIKGDIRFDNQIVGEEKVSVPAGTFSAVRVETTMTQHTVASRGPGLPNYPMNNTLKLTSWYAKGTGLVKTAYEGVAITELISFTK